MHFKRRIHPAAPDCYGACFDPATVAIVATAAGAGISAVGAIRQGNIAAKQASFQADVMQQQAARERQIAEGQEDEFRREQRRLLASRRAILGGSGVRLDTGSPLLASEDFVSETELQALKIRSGGDVRATRLEQQSTLTRFGGRAARQSGFIRAGALLLSGAGDAFGAGRKVKLVS